MILFNTSRFKNHMAYTSQTLRELPQPSGRKLQAPEKTEKLAPKIRPQIKRQTIDPKWAFNMGE